MLSICRNRVAGLILHGIKNTFGSLLLDLLYKDWVTYAFSRAWLMFCGWVSTCWGWSYFLLGSYCLMWVGGCGCRLKTHRFYIFWISFVRWGLPIVILSCSFSFFKWLAYINSLYKYNYKSNVRPSFNRNQIKLQIT